MSITEKRAMTRMDREKNYSIIIPHKNNTELLKRCLDSIPRREDVQIIVVDDNSDSDKVDFEHFPCIDDPYVEVVFTKEGKGAGYARNVGLTKAVGKWLLFADADDYYTDGFLQHLDKYIDSRYDLIYFGINGIDVSTKREYNTARNLNKRIREAIHNQEYDDVKFKSCAPWDKIIKRQLIKENQILFDETIKANDVMFSKKTAYYAKNIFLDEHKIYTRERRPNSLVSLRTLEANFAIFYVFIRVNVFLESIAQKKYKTNIILLLWHLIDIRNMKYYYKGIELIKENKIHLYSEFYEFCLSVPFLVLKKIKNKMHDWSVFLI